jgi:hemin uptake protein HemP
MVKKIQVIIELEPFEPDPEYYDGETDIDEMAKIETSEDTRAIISDRIFSGEGKISYRIVED